MSRVIGVAIRFQNRDDRVVFAIRDKVDLVARECHAVKWKTKECRACAISRHVFLIVRAVPGFAPVIEDFRAVCPHLTADTWQYGSTGMPSICLRGGVQRNAVAENWFLIHTFTLLQRDRNHGRFHDDVGFIPALEIHKFLIGPPVEKDSFDSHISRIRS